MRFKIKYILPIFALSGLLGCTDRGGLRDGQDVRQPQIPKEQQAPNPQEIIVKFKAETPDSVKSALQSQAGLTFIKAVPQLDIVVFEAVNKISADEAIIFFNKQPQVQYAELGQQVGVKTDRQR